MKKIYSFFLILSLAITLGFGQSKNFAGGDGSSSNPYQIATAQQLNDVRNFLVGNYFILTSDIDLAGWSWIPIGGGGTADLFNGFFNGNGYKIYNLSINMPSADNVGLFGQVGFLDLINESSGRITNVHLDGVSVAGRENVGSLVGKVIGSELTIIEGCYAINGSVSGSRAVGGLIGANNSVFTTSGTEREPRLRRSYANIAVSSVGSSSTSERFGGLVGCNQKGSIDNSYASGSVTVNNASASKVGGLVGSTEVVGKINRSYSTGQVSVNAGVTLVGGLVGTRGTVDTGQVTDSYWDTQTSGYASSDGGSGRTTAQMKQQATFVGFNFSSDWNIYEGLSYPFLRSFDLSSVIASVPLELVAGQIFTLVLSDAVDVEGNFLNGVFDVLVSSNNLEEGINNDGILHNGAITFANGVANVETLQLINSGNQVLSVQIQMITNPTLLEVLVKPAPAQSLVVLEQPTVVSGNFDDQPAILSPIVVAAVDAFGNVSGEGLNGPQEIQVSIFTDGSAESNANLGNAQVLDIQEGLATFEGLTIDKEGTGYVLRFISSGAAKNTDLGFVDTAPFDVLNIDDLSGFVVVQPQNGVTRVVTEPFAVDISQAKGISGALISGNTNVQVTSSVEGLIFNQDVSFTAGETSFNIVLANKALHDLTIVVDGITLPVVVTGINAVIDVSNFDLALIPVSGPYYAAIPFTLQILNAVAMEEGYITTANVRITSNLEGVVFDQIDVVFTPDAGNVDIELVLMTISAPGAHTLTVEVEGVTEPRTIDVVVSENISGFDVALTNPGAARPAGEPISLSISNATNSTTPVGDFTGSKRVTISSNLEGEVLNALVSFNAGTAQFPITLEMAGTHDLTVTVETITTNEVLAGVTVDPAEAIHLVITSGAVGNVVGINNGAPALVGSITLETQDTYGNMSTVGLEAGQTVGVTLLPQGGATGILSGTQTLDISTGSATFDNLFIDDDGSYILQFSSEIDYATKIAETNIFEVSNINNQAGFDLVDPGPQVVNQTFEVTFINAKNPDGSLLNGSFPVFIMDAGVFRNLYNASANFVDGSVTLTTTLGYSAEGLRNTLFRVDGNESTQIFLVINVVAEDGSGFTLTAPGNQIAGESFDLQITGATDKAGFELDGSHSVTVTSSNTNEGIDGLLFSGSLPFSFGATIPNLTLFTAEEQTLTVNIDWVSNPQTQAITVEPNIATQFVFAQQPTGFADGLYAGIARPVGTVVLQTLDAWNNLSVNGLGAPMDITASIASGTQGAILGGDVTLSLVGGEVTFDNLTLDKSGSYTLNFNFNGTHDIGFAPNPLVSAPFDMVNIEDFSGFTVIDPGKQYENLPFTLQLQNATDQFGTLLSGPYNVSLVSDQTGEGAAGVIYNQEFVFTDGALDIPLTLSTVAFHQLTITVDGLNSNNVATLQVEVAADLSNFTLTHDAPVYQNHPFDLFISNALNLDGQSLVGEVAVTISSNIAGEAIIFDGLVNFASGEGIVNLTLPTLTTYTLTVSVDGVTGSRNIDILVQENISGFLAALEVTGDKIAGELFNINITEATGLDGVLLGNTTPQLHWVLVTSNLGVNPIFEGQISFDAGVATLPLSLELAEMHTLTISITDITATQDVTVNVLPALVSQLALEVVNPPLGGTGTGDDIPTIIGTIIVRTVDAFGNPSVSGLEGTQTVTASLFADGSPAQDAVLGGTVALNILSGTAVFDDLTLNKDGVGYVIAFDYSGVPDLALTTVYTDPFNMEGVNLYQVALLDSNLQVLDTGANPLVFDPVIEGYTPVDAAIITIQRLGEGDITNLQVNINIEAAANFTPMQPLATNLWGTETTTTFSLQPNDALPVGVYSATLTVTANNNVVEQFTASFTVLAPYAMVLTDDVGQPLDALNPLVFSNVDEVYTPVSRMVTITNTGGNTLENLEVITEPISNFTFSALSATSVISGNTATFSVTPLAGLAPGTYVETVTVKDGVGNVTVSFDVSFTVIAYTYTISVTPTDDPIILPSLPEGYDPASAERVVTITSTSNGPITNIMVTLFDGASSNFEIIGTLPDLTFNGDATSFIVRPKPGLPSGAEYADFIIVNADNIVQTEKAVTFTVLQEFLWSGAVSSNWNDGGNWSPNTVPTDEGIARIPNLGVGGVYPVISTLVTISELTLESEASLTINAGSRLTLMENGILQIHKDAMISAPGDIRIQSGAVMTLEPGARLTSTGSFLNNAGVDGLLLKSDAQVSASLIHNSSGVLATVQRFMSGQKTHVIAPPVVGQSIQNFISTNPAINYSSSHGIYQIRHYDPASGWAPYYTGDTPGNMLNGRAYSILLTSNTQATFRGTLKHNNLEVSIPYNAGAFGWNGIGNPFATSIGARESAVVEDFLTVNQAQLAIGYEAIYLYDPDLPAGFRYHIINNTQTGYVKDYISHAQGFIVKAKDETSKITFTTGMRTHQIDDFYKGQEVDDPWHFMRIIATSGAKGGQTFVSFNPNMTTGMDVTYDAAMFVEDNSFKLYTRMPGVESSLNLGVQALPDNGYNDMVIPIGFRHTQGGTVTFSLASMELPAYLSPILEDAELGIFINLREESYIVDIPANTQPEETGRFFLHMEDTRVFYAVNFAAQNPGGAVQASVNENSLSSGDQVEEGMRVSFMAVPDENFALDQWILNGQVVADHDQETFVISELTQDVNLYAVFRSTLSDDTRLEELLVNGNLLENFDSMVLNYEVILPAGSSSVPVIDGTAFHSNAVVVVEQAQDIAGDAVSRTASITVTAENTVDEAVYNVLFSIEEIQLYSVFFGAGDDFGTLAATAEDNVVNSGDELPAGTSIAFTANPLPGYVLKQWVIDGVVLEDYTDIELVHDALQHDLDVQVYFEETTTQIGDTFNGDNLILYIFDGRLVIRGNVAANTRAVLYDMLGRKVRVELLQAGEYNSFSIKGLQIGVYMLHLSNPETNYTRKLFID